MGAGSSGRRERRRRWDSVSRILQPGLERGREEPAGHRCRGDRVCIAPLVEASALASCLAGRVRRTMGAGLAMAGQVRENTQYRSIADVCTISYAVTVMKSLAEACDWNELQSEP